MAALAQSVDSVAVIDAEGVITTASPSVESVLGYPIDQAIGLNGFDLIHPDDQLLAVEALSSTVSRSGRMDPLDLRVRHAAGGWLVVRMIAVNCLDDPEVAGIVLTIRDQTGMVEYERALVERDDRYRQIVEMAAEGVWIGDADVRTTFVTARMAAMLGYEPEEMIGRPAADFMDRDGRDDTERRLERRRAGISEQHAVDFIHRDGRRLHMRAASTPILDPDGNYRGTIAMISDVTELYHERARLAAEEARHRALLDALPDLVFRLDEEGTYLDFHARRLEDLAVPPEEFLGRRIRDVLPATADQAERAIAEAIRTGEVVGFEVVLESDGRRQTFESRVSPMPNRQVIVLVRDVTEHRAAESARVDLVAEVEQRRAHEQIRRRLERQTRLEALGRLAGGVAHDINNLLGVIGNYAAVVERSTSDPATRQDVQEIDAAVRRGSALTRRLLMFGRRDQCTSAVHDLAHIVDEVVGLLRRPFEPGHRLVVELTDRPCPVLVDRDQVGQALINLIVNAVDASPEGGEVHITVGPSRSAPAVDWVELAVIDHGSGMTTEVRDRAFEPFFTTKDERLGTGLGLSIVHGVAVDSAGTVEIDSVAGGGTTVRMRFPPAVSQSDVGELCPPTPIVGDDEVDEVVRVMVVDDDPHASRSAARLLNSAGFVVEVASTAAEALAGVRSGATTGIDVVLTDVVMPAMSGPALAAALRLEQPDLPVVLMTANAADLLAADLGDVMVLDKPLEADEVRRTLLAAVGRPV